MKNNTSGDDSAAIEFLELFRPGGPHVLTAINRDTKFIETRTFGTASDAESFVSEHNGERNIYFSVNPPTNSAPRNKKLERGDIKELAWLHVDLDPRAGENIDAEQARILKVLESPPGDLPPPTCIIFSGGGYQAFWKLVEPMPINGEAEAYEEAKRYNQQIELLLDADNCHNVDRIMRVPGTINVPDAGKRKKGRTEVLSELICFDADRVYPVSSFSQAPKAGSTADSTVTVSDNVKRLTHIDELDQWNVPDRVKVIIVQGHDPDNPKEHDNSRSAWLFDAACQLVRAGLNDDDIYSIITDPDFGISASVLDKRDSHEYAIRQIRKAKAFTELDKPTPEDSQTELISLAPVPEDLRPRPWVSEGFLLRGRVTLIAGKGGTGKSLLALQTAMMVATGQPWAHWSVREPLKVLILNAEDDLDESRRRLLSAASVMGINELDLVDKVLLYRASNFVLFERTPEDDKPKRTARFKQLGTLIHDNGIGLIITDPLVETHAGLDENSNTDMMAVIKGLRDLARSHDIPVLAVHHTRKNSGAGDQDSARGGSALVNACRIVLTMDRMSEDETKLLPDDRKGDRWRYVRVSGAKANYSGRGSDHWLRIESITLPNKDSSPGMVKADLTGTDELPAAIEDWPRLPELLAYVRQGRDHGAPYTAKSHGPMDSRLHGLLQSKFGLSREAARKAQDALLKAGLIEEFEYQTDNREKKMGVRVSANVTGDLPF